MYSRLSQAVLEGPAHRGDPGALADPDRLAHRGALGSLGARAVLGVLYNQH